MSTAESVVITLGCSEVRNSSALQALSSQRGACASVVVTVGGAQFNLIGPRLGGGAGGHTFA